MPRHLVELEVERPVELPQSLHHLVVDLGVGPALGLAQAVGFAAALGLLQAGEALGLVEVEVLVGDDPLEAQEILHAAQLAGRVADEALPAHKKHLADGEVAQPVLQVLGVDADLDGAPRRVDEARGSVFEGQALKGGNVRPLGERLRVVRDGSGHRVPHHHDELGVLGHGRDACRRLPGDKVTGCLLHGDLPFQGSGHQVPVPGEAFVVAAVEEVGLRTHGPHVGVHAQELEQRPRAALLHADDDGLRQLLAAFVQQQRQSPGWGLGHAAPSPGATGTPGQARGLFFPGHLLAAVAPHRPPAPPPLLQLQEALSLRRRGPRRQLPRASGQDAATRGPSLLATARQPHDGARQGLTALGQAVEDVKGREQGAEH